MNKFVMAAFAAFTAVLLASPAEARQHHYSHYQHYAHYRHHSMITNRHYSRRRGGACDGFQRCRCGTTAARYHGLPYAYKGFNLKLAAEWGRAFPHTSFGLGMVGVKPHHVLTVVGGSNCSSATVHDDAGTRQRNVCGFTFVSVNGGGFTRETSAQTRWHHRRHYASR